VGTRGGDSEGSNSATTVEDGGVFGISGAQAATTSTLRRS
jgi:hypothetical protein